MTASAESIALWVFSEYEFTILCFVVLLLFVVEVCVGWIWSR